MALKHLQAALAVCMGSAAALAALQAGAQEGGPPGSEAPSEMEGEIETVIVIGTMYRCPDGTMRGDITACPGYVSFPMSFFIANWDPVTRMIRGSHSAAQTCGRTPDANCKCGAGKVKVYDDNDDTFHCKPEPPATGCPNLGPDLQLRPECLEVRDEGVLWQCRGRH